MECPSCRGEGCPQCDKGRIAVTGCPLVIVGANVWRVVRLAEMTHENGVLPLAGGACDQAGVYLDACRIVWSVKGRCEQLRLDRR